MAVLNSSVSAVMLVAAPVVSVFGLSQNAGLQCGLSLSSVRIRVHASLQLYQIIFLLLLLHECVHSFTSMLLYAGGAICIGAVPAVFVNIFTR